MLKLKGLMYVPGTLDITPGALARLKEIGVTPPRNRFPQGGDYDSFYLPEGEDGSEFHHVGGNPACEGKLMLIGELK